MATATLTSRGRITLPEEVRNHLRVAAGDQVDFILEDGGTVRLAPVVASVRRLYGVLHQAGRPAPGLDEIHEAVGECLAMEDERIRKSGRACENRP